MEAGVLGTRRRRRGLSEASRDQATTSENTLDSNPFGPLTGELTGGWNQS
jgi:hypothetical protein